MPIDDEKRAATLFGVVCTIIFGVFFYTFLLNQAYRRYELLHTMPEHVQTGLFGGEYTVVETAALSDLSWSVSIFQVFTPTIVFIVFYPIVGRIILEISNSLMRMTLNILEISTDEWIFINAKGIVAGSLWSILVLVIPLEIVALIIVKTYSMIWFD